MFKHRWSRKLHVAPHQAYIFRCSIACSGYRGVSSRAESERLGKFGSFRLLRNCLRRTAEETWKFINIAALSTSKGLFRSIITSRWLARSCAAFGLKNLVIKVLLNLLQTCGNKIYRTRSTSMHQPKALRKFNWSAAPTRCRLSWWRMIPSPASSTRVAASTSKRRRASWRDAARDHSRWSFRSDSARLSRTVTSSPMWLLCNTTRNWSPPATLPSKSSATLENPEA